MRELVSMIENIEGLARGVQVKEVEHGRIEAAGITFDPREDSLEYMEQLIHAASAYYMHLQIEKQHEALDALQQAKPGDVVGTYSRNGRTCTVSIAGEEA